jgi:hypothetical protein
MTRRDGDSGGKALASSSLSSHIFVTDVRSTPATRPADARSEEWPPKSAVAGVEGDA